MRFNTLAEWLRWQEGLHPTEIDLGLERLKGPFQRLHLNFDDCTIFTVAGTNGKGSCATMLSNMLHNAGYRVGTYTSPHLLHYTERIRIDGVCINESDLCAAFAAVDAARQDTTLTYFEFGTLAALQYFSQRQCDVLVLEVGLGGRLDAVNIVDADVALITSVGLDHTDWLGSSVEEIALEKAGILRPGGRLACGAQPVPESLRERVRQLGVTACFFGEDYSYIRADKTWSFCLGDRRLENLPLPRLAGEFQLQNAATAITALQLAKDRVTVLETQIGAALATLDLPGRLQILGGMPLRIIDVAHNQQAAQVLAREVHALNKNRMPCHAVFAMLPHKDIEAVVAAMEGEISHWYLAALSGWGSARAVPGREPRTLPQIANFIKKYNDLSQRSSKVQAFPAVADAWRAACAAARHDSGMVVGFGSFLTVTEILFLE